MSYFGILWLAGGYKGYNDGIPIESACGDHAGVSDDGKEKIKEDFYERKAEKSIGGIIGGDHGSGVGCLWRR